MRPSCSVILEPELERGAPWGRDLFTFVSSAAGHMMRTLQKPRKNRPSKRQVNHRRFLHNMIQRKFADIEASNHRLASALFSTDEEKITSSEPTKPVTPETSDCPSTDVQSDPAGVSNALRDTDSKSVTGHTLDSHQSQVIKKKWPDSRNMWKHGNTKSPQKTNTIGGSHQGKGTYRQPCQDWGGNENPVEFRTLSSPNHTDLYTAVEHFQRENYSVENPLNATINLSEGSLFTWTENVKETNVNNSHLNQSLGTYPSFSPEVSQLCLDSCDFSIKFLTDISVCTQAKKNMVDIVESQWMDMMELLQPDRDVGDSTEVEPSFENICNADRMGGTCTDDITIVDQSESFMEYMPWSNSCCRGEVEHIACVGRSYTLGDACGCQQDQGSTTDLFISDQRTSQYALMSDSEEADLTSHKSSQGLDITPSQLSNYPSFHYDVPKHDMYSYTQQESLHMLLNCESNGCTPFDGVAQSFSAPIQKPQHYPIITPPLEDEWFVDILEESQSPEC